jgi:hypothetical protein
MRSIGIRFIAALLSLLSMPPGALAQSAPPAKDLQFETGLVWDSNITRGKDDLDRLSDLIVRAALSHERVFDLSNRAQAVLRGGLSAEALREHSRLNRASAELSGELRWRPSADFNAPTLGLFLDAGYDAFRSRLRDGARAAIGATVRAPLTDRIEVNAALAHNARRGRSAVFRLDDTSLRAGLDWRLGERTIAYGSVEGRSGDSVATGRTALDNLDLAEVFVDDDAYPGRDFQSYRFDARTVVLRLGVNWRVGEEGALDLSITRAGARPRERLVVLPTPRYFANQASLVYLIRF